MLRNIGLGLLVVVVLLAFVVYGVGIGLFQADQHAGTPSARSIDPDLIDMKEQAVREAALDIGVARPKQVLFGDLHVHSTFSFDAFTLSLPMTGGDGAHPVADACDFARHCSSLDFWSINDHAITLSPRRWSETVESIRQCNELAGSESQPDLVTYLGWEWTQVGATPETHLSNAVYPPLVVDIQQGGELHSVSDRHVQLLEHVPSNPPLSRERLHYRAQLRTKEGQPGPGHEFGDASALERHVTVDVQDSVVEAPAQDDLGVCE